MLESSLFLPVISTFFLSAFLGVAVLHLFPKWNLLDNPQKYGYDRQPIPLPGGVAPVLALLFAVGFFFPAEQKYIGLLVAILLLAIISFIDDRRQVHPLIRLSAHFVAASIAIASGIRIDYVSNPFGEVIELQKVFFLLPALITAFWLVGFTNVMNWLDGVPGLSAASAAAAGIFLGMLSLTPLVSQPEIALLSFVFAAASAGFLLFNFPPPRMLLGDTGAMVFGFFIAAISVFSGGKMATIFIVLAIPLLDAAYVTFRRLLAGRSPLSGKDSLHLHDRLLLLGLSNREILLFFLSLSLFLGWLSLQLETRGKIILVIFLSGLFLLFSYFLEKLTKKNFV